jgi:hypothetical protein
MQENLIHPSERHRIFVFGSNLAGRHGKGAALHAKEHYGAKDGEGWGLFGSSYALPTKDRQLRVFKLATIRSYVDHFARTIDLITDLEFNVTRIGCGLAGYSDKEIAPMFVQLTIQVNPSFRVYFDPAWQPYLGSRAKFWRTTNDT